jgi:uncharacterized metal-binding protein
MTDTVNCPVEGCTKVQVMEREFLDDQKAALQYRASQEHLQNMLATELTIYHTETRDSFKELFSQSRKLTWWVIGVLFAIIMELVFNR